MFWTKLRGAYPQPTLERPNVYHVGRVAETCCKRYCFQALSTDGGARRGSAVDILVVASGTGSSVRRVWDKHYTQQYVGGRKCSNRNTSSYVSGISPADVRIRYTYCCCIICRRSPSYFLHLLRLQLLLCCSCSCCCFCASVTADTALV